jgi:hypothetical protein
MQKFSESKAVFGTTFRVTGGNRKAISDIMEVSRNVILFFFTEKVKTISSQLKRIVS